MRCAWIGRGSGFVSRGVDSAFCPWWGLGFPRCRVSGTAILVAGIAVMGLCLLSVFACCQSLRPRTWASAVSDCLWWASLRWYPVTFRGFVLHLFVPRCLFVADSGLAAYPGLPRFRGGCCGWCCGFWCCLLGDAASGISARHFSNCLTEPLIFPMRI